MARGERVEPHVGEFRAGAHLHALLLAAGARRRAAADAARHRRAAGPAAAAAERAPGERAELFGGRRSGPLSTYLTTEVADRVEGLRVEGLAVDHLAPCGRGDRVGHVRVVLEQQHLVGVLAEETARWRASPAARSGAPTCPACIGSRSRPCSSACTKCSGAGELPGVVDAVKRRVGVVVARGRRIGLVGRPCVVTWVRPSIAGLLQRRSRRPWPQRRGRGSARPGSWRRSPTRPGRPCVRRAAAARRGDHDADEHGDREHGAERKLQPPRARLRGACSAASAARRSVAPTLLLLLAAGHRRHRARRRSGRAVQACSERNRPRPGMLRGMTDSAATAPARPRRRRPRPAQHRHDPDAEHGRRPGGELGPPGHAAGHGARRISAVTPRS